MSEVKTVWRIQVTVMLSLIKKSSLALMLSFVATKSCATIAYVQYVKILTGLRICNYCKIPLSGYSQKRL